MRLANSMNYFHRRGSGSGRFPYVVYAYAAIAAYRASLSLLVPSRALFRSFPSQSNRVRAGRNNNITSHDELHAYTTLYTIIIILPDRAFADTTRILLYDFDVHTCVYIYICIYPETVLVGSRRNKTHVYCHRRCKCSHVPARFFKR